MVERIRFEGIEHEVVVDRSDPHTCHEAAIHAYDQHRAMLNLSSDEGLSYHYVYSMLGEHRQVCKEGEDQVEHKGDY